MSLKRASSCLLLEEPATVLIRKKARLIYDKPYAKYVLKLTGKRSPPSLQECSELFKRVRLDLNTKRGRSSADICNEISKRARLEESNINLLISEAPPVKKPKYVVFVRVDLEMAYCQSVDPRNFYATDIQKIVRGWSTRKSIKQGLLLNSFN